MASSPAASLVLSLILLGAGPTRAQEEGEAPTSEPKPEAPSPAKPAPEPKPEPKPAPEEAPAPEPEAKPDPPPPEEKEPEEAEPEPEPKPAPKAPEPAPEPTPEPKPKAAPKPRAAPPARKPKPKAAPKPRAAPPSAPEPAAAPSPAEDKPHPHQERYDKLLADIEEQMRRAEPQAGTLEALCTAWQPASLYELDPLLQARLKTCAGRAALLAGRNDRAEDRLDDAIREADGRRGSSARLLLAEARYYRARLQEAQTEEPERCGAALGLRDLRRWEVMQAARVRDELLAAYRAVIETRVDPWRARAVVDVARVAAEHYRKTVRQKPETYRGLDLPSPLRVDEVDGPELLEPKVGKNSAWAREIERLYEVAVRVTGRAGLTDLRAEAEKELAAFRALGPIEAEAVRSPLREAAFTGVIRYAPRTDARGGRTRFEQLAADGRFEPIGDERAKRLLSVAVSERDAAPAEGDDAPPRPTARAAWAAAALAEAGEKVDLEPLLAGLEDERLAVRLLILRAVEVAPFQAAYEPLVSHFEEQVRAKAWDGAAYDKRFATLQSALYGEEERTLLALRSVVDEERTLLTKVTYENGLPWDERAFLIAETGDSRARYRVQEMVSVGDDRTGAISLYAFHKTMGKRSTWVLRQYRHGRMGCVGQALLDLEAEREQRMKLDPQAGDDVP